LSIDEVHRGQELVDFEKVNSLEGVFLANKFESEGSAVTPKAKQAQKKQAPQKEFSKADIDSANIQKSRMNQG
jgi:hypothetical protein